MSPQPVPRRAVVRGAVWALPAVAVSSAAAAQCVSDEPGKVLDCSQLSSGALLSWSDKAPLRVDRHANPTPKVYSNGVPFGKPSALQCSMGNMHWQPPHIVDCETGYAVTPTHVSVDADLARATDAVSVQTIGQVDPDGTMHEGLSVQGVRTWVGQVFGSFVKAPKPLVTEGQDTWLHMWIESTMPARDHSSCSAPGESNRAMQRILISLPMTVTFHRFAGDKEQWQSNGCSLYFNILVNTDKDSQCVHYSVIDHPTTNKPMVWFSQNPPTVVP
ncbi:MAG: hypothetical protein Q4Q03_02675 [Bowdeniella nasicola]|nr:hypothetical protein [Bowdeniella nasicola]